MHRTLIIIAAFVWHLHMPAQNIFRTACDGNLEQLKSMLSNTAIDTKDNRGRSLLHWAVACKQKAVFDFLIASGIRINTLDDQEKTPMHIAVEFDNKDYLHHLINAQHDTAWQSLFGASLLEIAVLKTNKALIKALISNGIDVDAINQRGSTALEISQRIGALDVSELLIAFGAEKSLVRTFKMEGPYMGQEKPDKIARMFSPNFISTEEQEFGSVFNKAGTAFYFGVDVGGRNEIRFSKMEDNKWTPPITLLSHERYSYNDPFLSNDETKLYFISQSALDGKGKVKDIDIWYIEKTADGWSEPINAGSNINTNKDEYYISFTNDGTIYFASNGLRVQDTTRTDHDIYYAKFIDKEFQKPVLLDATVNTEAYEADVFISPDESYMIFCSTRNDGYGKGDLYISFKNADDNWEKAINMGKSINTKYYEYCPFVTQDGKYLFFTSNQDIYWVSTEIIKDIKKNGG